MIHVCYGLYDRDGKYSKFCGTSIVSIFENTNQDITIHILHDNTLTADNRDKLVYLAGKYNQQIKFYNVESFAMEKFIDIKNIFPNISNSPFTLGTMYRLIIAEIISYEVKKIIYLDCGDTVVNCDIADLWNIDIKNYPCAAVPEVSNGNIPNKFLPLSINGVIANDDYFNAGVMVFNLEYLRNNNFSQLKNFAEFPQEYKNFMILFDQDLLNLHFSKKYLKLPQKYNAFVRLEISKMAPPPPQHS